MKKTNLDDLHLKIYNFVQKKATSYEGQSSKELKQYRLEQKKLCKRKFKFIQTNKFLNDISFANLIFIGDFHTFDQNTRNLERICKKLLSKTKSLVLALEMVPAKHQLFLDAYLENNITELEFLESIGYSNSWKFPWNHYRPVFELAKKHNMKGIALNSNGSLSKRDLFAAKKLASNLNQEPESKILVLFGELHILPSKIPKKLDSILPGLNYKIVHQNLDDLYWRIPSQKRGRPSVIQFSDIEFSLQTSPPWIKYESMIYWFENLIDDPDFDVHEYIIETGQKIFSSSTQDYFHSLLTSLLQALKIENIIDDDLFDFNLLDHTKLDQCKKKLQQVLNLRLYDLHIYQLSINDVLNIYGSNYYYCSNYSANRLAYVAGIHLQKVTNYPNGVNSFNTQKDYFYYYTQLAASGYLNSKIFNPYRKCELYRDLKRKKDKISVLAVIIIDYEEMPENLFYKWRLKTIYEVSKVVGHFLGNTIYEKLSKKQKSSFSIISSFYSKPLDDQRFIKLKKDLFSSKSYKMRSKRYF